MPKASHLCSTMPVPFPLRPRRGRTNRVLEQIPRDIRLRKKAKPIHFLCPSSSCLLASLIRRTKDIVEKKATIVRRKKIIRWCDERSKRNRYIRQAPKIIQLIIRSILNISNLKNFFIFIYLRGSQAPSFFNQFVIT